MDLAASPVPPHDNSIEPFAHVLSTERSWLSSAPLNVLLIGDKAATDAAVRDLQSAHQNSSVTWHCGGLPLVVPPSEPVSTVILHDAAVLSPGEQQMLSDWLSLETCRTRVVTTSSVPLFPLVESGAFMATLYYRLNVIYVEVPPSALES